MAERKKPKRASRTSKASAKETAPANGATAHLTMLQERFVQEYLADPELNATAAYARAGYTATGQAARTAASRLLKNPAVKAAIDAVRAASAAKFEITRERVMQEYAALAFTDPRRFFRDDGTLKHPTELDDATAAALKEFEVEEEYEDIPEREDEAQPHGGKLKRTRKHRTAVGQTAKVKWADKKGALDSIVRLMGWLKEEAPPGSTPENPIHMIVQGMQHRKSALTPNANPDDLEDDE